MYYRLFFALLLSLLTFVPGIAQYDQPIVYSGLATSLEADGQAQLAASTFLVPGTLPACLQPEVLIADGVFNPMNIDSVPPPDAAPTMTLGCGDLGTKVVDIWYRRLDGRWTVVQTYTLVFGYEGECECPQSDCAEQSVSLVNGLAAPTDATGRVTVAARSFLAQAGPPFDGWTYSYSLNPADSLRTFDCAQGATQLVTITALSGGQVMALPVDTYLLLSCSPDAAFFPAVVLNGIAIGLSDNLAVPVPARAFAPVYPMQEELHYAYSPDPADTLRVFDCDDEATTRLDVFVFTTGQAGPVRIPTYLWVEDMQLQCGGTNLYPPPAGDEPAGAVDISFLAGQDCRLAGNNYGAGAGFSEVQPPLDCGQNAWCDDGVQRSIWYRFTATDPAGRSGLQLISGDTVQVAVYRMEGDLQLIAAAEFTATDTLYYCSVPGEELLVQIDSRDGRPLTFQLGLLAAQESCSTSAVAPRLLPLQLYPNPARHIVRLQLPSADAGRLRLWDSSGRLQQERWVQGPEYRLDLGACAPGIYFVEWSSASFRYGSRLVVQP